MQQEESMSECELLVVNEEELKFRRNYVKFKIIGKFLHSDCINDSLL